MNRIRVIGLSVLMLAASLHACAQYSAYDTIRLGAIVENGNTYPMVFLPDFVRTAPVMNTEERIRRDRLRNNVYVVYPYAITAAAIFKEVNDNLDKYDARRDRKKYLKTIDRKLDKAFKEPLKNLSIDQGHILIKLISRQTGQDCYSIVKELKGGFSAMLWQSVGVFFNNNLKHDYDPNGDDKEIEFIVRDLEASTAYQYQLYQQQQLMSKIAKP